MVFSPPEPLTPDNTPKRFALNRSFTVPIDTTTASKSLNQPAEIGSSNGYEILYGPQYANIIQFTAKSRPTTSSSSPGRPQSSSGTLPWASPAERTVAAGPFEIYRVPGSVSFLRSGEFLHTIMGRSPCWCVDGVSKFVLRCREQDTYYRVELPGESEEDLEEVEKFKITLQKVLFYEKMACPFARSFEVDLPEEKEERKKRRKSTGPAKKWKLDRVWRPEGWVEPEDRGSEDSGSVSGSSDASDDESKHGSSGNRTPVESETPPQRIEPKQLSTRARALAALRSASAPQQPHVLYSPSPSRLRTKVDVDGTVEARAPITSESGNGEVPRMRTLQAIPTDMPPSPPDSSAGLEYLENDTQSEAGAADVRTHESDEGTRHEIEASDESIDGMVEGDIEPTSGRQMEKDDIREEDDIHGDVVDSERMGESSASEQISDTTDEPGRESEHLPHDPSGDGDLAELCNTRFSGREQADEESIDDRPTTPVRQLSDEDPYAAIQARILARRSIGGTTSFHPGNKSPTRQSTSSTSSTATITSNNSTVSRRSQSSHRQQAFASAMVKKAYSVFLGPPAHLVAIMLRIAARFANGAFGVDSMFYVETPVDSPRQVPGSYHLQGDDVVEEFDYESDEDDFGVPLRSPVRLASARSGSSDGLRERPSRGWDVD